MKRLVCSTSLIALVFIIVGFSAQSSLAYSGNQYAPSTNFSPYFTITGGAWLPSNSSSRDTSLKPSEARYDGGFGISGAVGMDLGRLIRLENELSYRYAGGRGNSDTWALGWMLNAWLQARNQTPVTPYFCGGFGLGRGHVATAGIGDGDVTGVAYQAGAGLDIALDRRTSLDIGYRYFGISDTGNNAGNGGNDLAGSSIMGGVRVRF